MYKDKFVLSIINDGYPVREFRSIGNSEVALRFGSEYKIRLKNKNDRSCTARVFIDGKKVSTLGDLIIHPSGTIDLERFISTSLDSGKKFKFVKLNDSSVDDPTSSQNGIIKVEFRLATQKNSIKIQPKQDWKDWYVSFPPYTDGGTFDNTSSVIYSSSNGDFSSKSSSNYYFSSKSYNSNINSMSSSNNYRGSVEDGATVEGDNSNQSFQYDDLQVEEYPTTILSLKIVGIKEDENLKRRTIRYCPNCGRKSDKQDKFCANCGKRLK